VAEHARVLLEREAEAAALGRLLDRASGWPQRDAILELMRGRVALADGRPGEALDALLATGEVFDRLDVRQPSFAPWA
jgi:hypothetical protein